MARTRLFSLVRKAIAQSSRTEAGRIPHSRINRRQLLQFSAALLATSGLPTNARANAKAPSVAVIGGGVAGLTTAYRLRKAGLAPVIYEASNGLGGRMLTHRDFYQGLFCELGGEFVDSNHDDLKALANELNVALQPLDNEGGEDFYFFGGKFRTPQEMLYAAKQSGAFRPIAEQIASDNAKLRDASGNWTDHAASLDQMSLRDYLKQFRGKAQGWAVDLLDVAYVGEFGLESSEQSALNLVEMIGTDTEKPFLIYGESDEAFRIKGGSSVLIEALAAALNDTPIRLAHELVELSASQKSVTATFDTPKAKHTETFDIIVLTLPFTRLRQVSGLDTLQLSPEKLQCIRELGYGTSAKVMVGTRSRVWRTGGPRIGLPGVSNGTFYTDLPLQSIWETSRGQGGEAGILTNFLGGKAGEAREDAAFQALRAGLTAMSPELAASIIETEQAAYFWARHPNSLGSYACPKPGQYTTFIDLAAEPALDGRIQFAGEHTSPDFLGYMNGGVQSANRAAAAVLELSAVEQYRSR